MADDTLMVDQGIKPSLLLSTQADRICFSSQSYGQWYDNRAGEELASGSRVYPGAGGVSDSNRVDGSRFAQLSR